MYFVAKNGMPKFDISITCPTVIEPMQQASFKLLLNSKQFFKLVRLNFDSKDTPVEVGTNKDLYNKLPLSMGANKQFEWRFPLLSTDSEGYGEVLLTIVIENEQAEEESFSIPLWLSVFKKQIIKDNRLSDLQLELLKSLISYRKQNKHIFIANYKLFFQDFMNLVVKQDLIDRLAKKWKLPVEGLPVNNEIRYGVMNGDYTFYVHEQFEPFKS